MSDTNKKIRYSKKIKADVLAALEVSVEDGGPTAEELHKQYGPCVNTINKWRREAKKGEPLSSDSELLLRMALKDDHIRESVIKRLLSNDFEFQRTIVAQYRDRLEAGLAA